MNDTSDQPADETDAPIPSAHQSRRGLLRGAIFSGSIHGSILALILFGFPILHLVIERESSVASLTVVSDPQEASQAFDETGIQDNNFNDDKMRKGGAQFLADDPASKKIPVEKSDVPTTLGGSSDDQNPTEAAPQPKQGNSDLSSDTEGTKQPPQQSQNARDAVAPQPNLQPPTQLSQQADTQIKPTGTGPTVVLTNAEALTNDRKQTASDAVEAVTTQVPGQNSAAGETGKPSQASPSQTAATLTKPAAPRTDAGATNQIPGQTAQNAAEGETSASGTAGSSVAQNAAPATPQNRPDTVLPSSSNPQAPDTGFLSTPAEAPAFDPKQNANNAVATVKAQASAQNPDTRQADKPSLASPSQIAATATKASAPQADAGATNQIPGQTAQNAAASETSASGTAGFSVAQSAVPANPETRPQTAPVQSSNPQAPDTGLLSAPVAPKADTRIAPPPAPHPTETASQGLPPPKTPTEVVDRLAEELPRIASIRAGILAARKRPPGAMVPATDSPQSVERLEKFAEQGYGHAQFALAGMMLTGEGLPRDPARGKELATKAALSGYLPAQLLLGAMAADGGSAEQPRDLGEAHAWFSLAAGNDSKPAAEAVKALNSMMEVKDVIKSKQRQSELRQVSAMLSPQTNTKLSAKEAGDKLRQAAALGDLETVTVMLAQGADADSSDEDGRTALIEASWRGYANIVSTLIQQGANVGQTDANGKSPLMWAAINGYASVARILLDAGQNPNLQDSTGVSALM